MVADKRESGSTALVGGTHPFNTLVMTAEFDVSVLDRTKDTTVRVEYHPSSWSCTGGITCGHEGSGAGYVQEKTVGYQEISIPQLQSARIGDGMLALGFDVDMDVELSDLTKASVREKGTTSPVVELANLTLTSGQSDSTILVDLGTNLDGVQSMTQPELVLQSAAFSAGPSRETEAATADIAKDATAPSVSSVTVTSRTAVEVQFPSASGWQIQARPRSAGRYRAPTRKAGRYRPYRESRRAASPILQHSRWTAASRTARSLQSTWRIRAGT